MDFDKYISILTLSFVVIGGGFAWFQWRQTTKLKRAEFINQLTEKIRSDKDICKTILLFDYDHAWYTAAFHNGDDGQERVIDKTLSYFSYICYLRSNRLITKTDFKFFLYEVTRIRQNRSVINYLYNLHHFARKLGCPMTFQYLLDYCKPNFPPSFNDPQSTDYPHYLNF